jgi:chondroitin AC lyase
MDSLISFADAAESYDFNALAGMVRFNNDGKIDARDGDKYVLGSDISYQPEKSHRFRLLADIATKKYDAYVTLPGSSSESLIASGLNFRTSQQSVSQISKLVLWSRLEELKVKIISAKAVSKDLVPPEIVEPPKVNQAPTVSAGFDRAITLPENSVQIMASASDADGSIASYSWAKVSGPSQVSVSGASTPSLSLSNLAVGEYIYRVRVTDNEGASAEDRVSIVVNAAPILDLISRDANFVIHDLSRVFNARFELIFDATPATLTMDSLISFSDAAEEYNFNSLAGIVRFNTSGKIDARDGDKYILGSDLSYQQAKSHRFRLLADIATKKYDAYVTLPGSSNETLIASGLNFRTSQQSVTKISKMVLWSRFEELKVKLISANAVTKNLLPPQIVEPPKVNQAPTVSAGNDKEITLPTNSVQVSASASDSDGSIASYSWTKVSGPSQVSVSGASNATLSLSNLAEGEYVYRIIVTDNQGATAEDRVSIVVNPQEQDAPIQGRIDIPSLTVIKLPLDSVALTASVQTPNGVILSYDWVRVSGPSLKRVYGHKMNTLTFYDLIVGEYVWKLNVKYTANDTLTKTVKLVVQPADTGLNSNIISFMSYYMGLMKAEYRYSSTTAERTRVANWSNTMRSDGSWSDIDYAAGEDAMGRTQRMAKAWATPGHEFYQSSKIKQQVMQAVRYWCNNGYYTKHYNWYVRDISSPLFGIIPSVIHFWNDFSAADKVEIKKALSSRPVGLTGANAINIAEKDMIRGILYNEPVVMNAAIFWIKGLLRRGFTEEYGQDCREGMTPDDGFMQHGDVFYLGGYGTEFISPMSKFFKNFSGSTYDFNNEEYASFEGLLLNGYKSFFRGKTLDYFVSGRAMTRLDYKNIQVDVADVADVMSKTRTTRKAEFEQLRDSINQNKPLQYSKNKVFFSSDTVAHIRPKFNVSVHMFSKRMLNTDAAVHMESIRSHNIKDGSMLTFQTGNEYVGILPVWDWNRIPGTTSCHVDLSDHKKMRSWGITDHVGGVSDGVNGLAAMDFQKPIVTYHLSAKKAWFLFDEGVVALGTGIKGVDCPREMETIVEQNFATSSVANLSNGIHHANTAYIPLGTTKIQHEVKAQSGTNYYVNQYGSHGSKTVITKNVFTASIEHGQNPANASYAYIVAPGTTLTAAQSMSQSSLGITYVNNSTVQAVYFAKTKIIMASFYKAGTLNIAGRILKVDRPALVMVKTQNRELLVSDPIQSQTYINVEYTDENSDQSKKTIFFPEGLMVGSTTSMKY